MVLCSCSGPAERVLMAARDGMTAELKRLLKAAGVEVGFETEAGLRWMCAGAVASEHRGWIS